MRITNKTPKYRSTILTTKNGDIKVTYHSFVEGSCVSLSSGNLSQNGIPVRVHSSCLFSEAFDSIGCDCRLQLSEAIKTIMKNGGVIIYLYQEGRGHGLEKKINSMEIERKMGIDTVEAFKRLKLALDPRDYTVAIKALKELNINPIIKFMSNNPRKKKQMEEGGFLIEKLVQLKYPVNKSINKYLKVKKSKLGHLIDDELFLD